MMKEFESYLHSLMKQSSIPGIGIAIARDGELIYQKGFGFRNIKEQLPIDIHTVFGIGSLTKSFTATAILQLHEKGKINIYESITNYLPELCIKSANEMSIHHLLTHSTGIPPLSSLFKSFIQDFDRGEDSNLFGYINTSNTFIDSYGKLIHYINENVNELLGTPGTEFSYSNDGYALLGYIIERASGEGYWEYIRKNICEPLKMKRTVLYLKYLEEHGDTSTLYSINERNKNKKIVESNVWLDAPTMHAAGFLKSTLNDLIKYFSLISGNKNIENNTVLSQSSIEKILKPHIQMEPNKYYGYGLNIIQDYHGNKMIEHGGSLHGVSSHTIVIPDKGITAVILSNIENVPVFRLLNYAINILDGREMKARHNTFVQNSLKKEKEYEYCGTFESEEGMSLIINQNDYGLTFSSAGLRNLPLQYVNDDSFIIQHNDAVNLIRFIRDSNQQICRVYFGLRQLMKIN